MLRFLLRRVALIVPTFVGVTLLSFLLIHLVPGDPIEVRFGERGVSPERLAMLRHEAGLDRPLWQQFLTYEEHVVTGHLGESVVTHEPVWTEFTELFPATVELSVCAMLFAVIVGLPLGVIAAVRRGAHRRRQHRQVVRQGFRGAGGQGCRRRRPEGAREAV